MAVKSHGDLRIRQISTGNEERRLVLGALAIQADDGIGDTSQTRGAACPIKPVFSSTFALMEDQNQGDVIAIGDVFKLGELPVIDLIVP